MGIYKMKQYLNKQGFLSIFFTKCAKLGGASSLTKSALHVIDGFIKKL